MSVASTLFRKLLPPAWPLRDSEMLLPLSGCPSFRAQSPTQMQSELRVVQCITSVNELYCWSTEWGGERMWKEGKSRKEPRKESGIGNEYSIHYQSVCASYTGPYWLLQSKWHITLVNFYETDLNKMSTVPREVPNSHKYYGQSCMCWFTLHRASATVYQLSLYKAKATTDVSRD